MNSVVRPNFKVFFAEKSICESCEQCTGSTVFQQNAGTHDFCAFQTHTKSTTNTTLLFTTINMPH